MQFCSDFTDFFSESEILTFFIDKNPFETTLPNAKCSFQRIFVYKKLFFFYTPWFTPKKNPERISIFNTIFDVIFMVPRCLPKWLPASSNAFRWYRVYFFFQFYPIWKSVHKLWIIANWIMLFDKHLKDHKRHIKNRFYKFKPTRI